MIIRYNQILDLNLFFKKYIEVTSLLFKFNFFNDLIFYENKLSKLFCFSLLFKKKKIYLNFVYFYFIIFFNNFTVNNFFFKNFLYLNFSIFKQFFFFLYYLKINNNNIIIIDDTSYNFISKFIINKNIFNNWDSIFNYFLIFKKIKIFIFLDKNIYNFFKLKYSDFDVVILFFPFNYNIVFKFFLNNLLYKIY